MLSSRQKATRLIALMRAVSDSASSEEPGMRARLVYGNREISAPPPTGRVGGRMVKAEVS
jgi:hypothetical protein